MAFRWLAYLWVSERTKASLSARAARPGRCSLRKTPGAFVAMAAKSPRMPSAASGLGSKVSIWLGPPVRKTRIRERARGGRGPGRRRLEPFGSSQSASFRPSSAEKPTWRNSRRRMPAAWWCGCVACVDS